MAGTVAGYCTSLSPDRGSALLLQKQPRALVARPNHLAVGRAALHCVQVAVAFAQIFGSTAREALSADGPSA